MPFRKAIDDLRETTLKALPGRWLKLLYFARLRRSDPGKYTHWGFEGKYGKEADSAFREAHGDVFRDALQSPLPDLLIDAENHVADPTPLEQVMADELMPSRPSAESESHFRYVLASVKALLKAEKRR